MRVKLTERQWMIIHAGSSFALALLVSNTAFAQALDGAAEFLDDITKFFKAIGNHEIWPTILGVWILGSTVLYAKTRNPVALVSAVGCAAGAAFWAARAIMINRITHVNVF